MVDAALATSAAPTYFREKDITLDNVTKSYVDGGLACNNPSLMLIALANT